MDYPLFLAFCLIGVVVPRFFRYQFFLVNIGAFLLTIIFADSILGAWVIQELFPRAGDITTVFIRIFIATSISNVVYMFSAMEILSKMNIVREVAKAQGIANKMKHDTLPVHDEQVLETLKEMKGSIVAHDNK